MLSVGCGRILGPIYASPRLRLYSIGLIPPNDVLILFSLNAEEPISEIISWRF